MADRDVDHGWTERDFGTVCWHPPINTNVRVCVGIGGVVEIDKLYGPLAVYPIRARIDYDACCWVIERETEGPPDESGDTTHVWVEVARAPCWPPEVPHSVDP